ncbi:class I SAM-dependent methyltransferase [Streptomyces sp. NPDC050560]|uniref:class I SAM-dependent methyltransferase n=1 Tax=Streptomyces sp. NPDC050560 TaxID=3365630 RepID=UPI003798D0DB
MVTIPSSPAPEPHLHRRMAESFGVDPARYDRARAPYPQAVVDRVLAAARGTRILDVGCGTGIVARQFLAAGRTVLGVEPDPRMADFARRGGVEAETATFEEWDPAGRTFDAVVSGTAWHWVDPVAGAAKAARVLRPGGVLAPFGHVFELPPPLAKALAAAVRKAAPDSPAAGGHGSDTSILDAYRGLYDRAADGIREAGGFEEPEVWRHDWQHTYTASHLLDLLRTSGGLTSLPPDRATEVLTPLTTMVTTQGGTATVRYTTWGVTAVRAGTRAPRAGERAPAKPAEST